MTTGLRPSHLVAGGALSAGRLSRMFIALLVLSGLVGMALLWLAAILGISFGLL